jgi:hypothetical protein
LELSFQIVYESIDGIQILGYEFVVQYLDAVSLFQERHQLQHARRINDPLSEKRIIVRKMAVRMAKEEIIADKLT